MSSKKFPSPKKILSHFQKIISEVETELQIYFQSAMKRILKSHQNIFDIHKLRRIKNEKNY